MSIKPTCGAKHPKQRSVTCVRDPGHRGDHSGIRRPKETGGERIEWLHWRPPRD